MKKDKYITAFRNEYGASMDSIVYIVGAAVIAAVFLFGRELICWYFKINAALSEFQTYRVDVRIIRKVLVRQYGMPEYTKSEIVGMSFDELAELARALGFEPANTAGDMETQILDAQKPAN